MKTANNTMETIPYILKYDTIKNQVIDFLEEQFSKEIAYNLAPHNNEINLRYFLRFLKKPLTFKNDLSFEFLGEKFKMIAVRTVKAKGGYEVVIRFDLYRFIDMPNDKEENWIKCKTFISRDEFGNYWASLVSVDAQNQIIWDSHVDTKEEICYHFFSSLINEISIEYGFFNDNSSNAD